MNGNEFQNSVRIKTELNKKGAIQNQREFHRKSTKPLKGFLDHRQSF
jgi:hypothetical protein